MRWAGSWRTLDEQGLTDNTLVWFTSDNGPARTKWHNAGSPGPLREFKGHMYEGGIRVPGIVRWPGHVKPGAVSDVPVCGTDFLPTVCDIAGIAPPGDRTIDGISMRPLLEHGELKREKPLYWEFIYAQSPPALALRQGDWKILAGLTDARAAHRVHHRGEQSRLEEFRADRASNCTISARTSAKPPIWPHENPSNYAS